MSYHSELDAELRGLTRLPADVLTMPAVPWIDLDEDDSYAWYVSLAGAIARAHELGRTCELRSPDGEPVAVIGPPPKPALPPWITAVNGAGKHSWFVLRDEHAPGFHDLPFSERYHARADGYLIRYKSMDLAQKAADKLNESEKR